jgi:hypothetical protein
MIIPKPKKQLTLPKLLKKAQDTFNKYIRERDKDECCITCGKYKIEHACHFYSAGHYTGLRFNEDNVHGGCLQCNYFKHGSGNEYRRNIVKRIGEQRLLLLDAAATRNRFKKWSRVELEIIIQEYKDKLKKAA